MMTLWDVRRERVIRTLFGIAFGLAAASYAVREFAEVSGHNSLYGLVRILDVDRERSVSTWFQVLVLAACSLALWACGRHERDPGQRLAWRWFSGLLALMSLDEQIGVHEIVRARITAIAAQHGSLLPAGLTLGSALAVVALAATRFLLRRPPAMRRRILVAGSVYLLGAVGFEVAAAVWIGRGLPRGAIYRLMPTFEELLEMLGMIALLDAAWRHHDSSAGSVRP